MFVHRNTTDINEFNVFRRHLCVLNDYSDHVEDLTYVDLLLFVTWMEEVDVSSHTDAEQ